MTSKRKREVSVETALLLFVKTAATSLIFTILWIPVYCFRCLLVYLLPKLNPSYGRIMDENDLTKEENYWKERPKTTLTFTLVVNAPIKLQEFRQLFTRNVLEAKVQQNKKGGGHEDKLRFRELRQYQTEFLGYRFWKDDPTFTVNNHITEELFSEKFADMSRLHTEMANKFYPRYRSPWDITLVRSYRKNASKTLIVVRAHHSMADAKSMLKLLVESLGEKPIAEPNVQRKEGGILDLITYYALMPFYFVYSQVYWSYMGVQARNSPLKYKMKTEPLLNVGVASPVLMSDVKQIAKRNGVTTSAVIMAAMVGGIRKSDSVLAENNIPCKWMLPKPKHPERLTNHVYAGVMYAPTNMSSPSERLEKCQEIFTQFKSSNLYVYDRSVLFQTGTWFNPLRGKWMQHKVFPLILTNVAGDSEGFSIGSHPVSELSMTCAPHAGACGVIIAGFSYKDGLEFTVTSKQGILDAAQTKKLAELMAQEVEILKDVQL